MSDYYICKKDELRPFFDAILEAEPRRVLDVGMLLKRSGAIGRMVCGSHLPEDMILDGLDVPGASFLPAYDVVYDHIFHDDEWKKAGEYDMVLAFFLSDEILDGSDTTDSLSFWRTGFMEDLKKWCSENGAILVTEQGVMLPETPRILTGRGITSPAADAMSSAVDTTSPATDVTVSTDVISSDSEGAYSEGLHQTGKSESGQGTRMFICAHKPFTPPEGEMYVPLQVGSALGEDLGMTRDDSGDNISTRNKSFCELTGIYWIWKNVTCDIAGICHYRRYFVYEDDFLKKEEIEKTLGEYDIILPDSAYTKESSVKAHYDSMHYISDLELTREVISEMYPEYLPEYDHVLSCNLMSLGNMMICKKQLFDDYCQWLFDILFEVEKLADISGYDEFQARLFGYLSERLLRVWVMHRALRVYEYAVEVMDPVDSENAVRKVEMTSRMIDLYLQDVSTLTASGKMQDLVEYWPPAPDFGGRIPVFVCWWQGFDQAPDTVRLCLESIRRNIPEDRCVLCEIRAENMEQYIYLPIHIMERYRDGRISLTHLSDVLRVMLLYRYGGLWLDATYFLAKPLEPEFFDRDFFTLRSRTPKWRADIVQGRWSCNLMLAKPGDPLMGFLVNAFCYYYFKTEELVDYYVFDYIIDLGIRCVPGAAERLEQVPYTDPEVMNLMPLMDKRFDQARYGSLISETSFFKLTYRSMGTRSILTGEETYFGHLCKEFEIN